MPYEVDSDNEAPAQSGDRFERDVAAEMLRVAQAIGGDLQVEDFDKDIADAEAALASAQKRLATDTLYGNPDALTQGRQILQTKNFLDWKRYWRAVHLEAMRRIGKGVQAGDYNPTPTPPRRGPVHLPPGVFGALGQKAPTPSVPHPDPRLLRRLGGGVIIGSVDPSGHSTSAGASYSERQAVARAARPRLRRRARVRSTCCSASRPASFYSPHLGRPARDGFPRNALRSIVGCVIHHIT